MELEGVQNIKLTKITFVLMLIIQVSLIIQVATQAIAQVIIQVKHIKSQLESLLIGLGKTS